jgi:hypothetical protein
MSGELEMEIEKILNHTGKLYTHIMQNLYLSDIINESSLRIARMKKAKALLKNKFLINSAKVTLMGTKKTNLLGTHILLKDIQILKGISENLKSGTGDFYELIETGRGVIARYEGYNLNVFKLFVKEYDNHLNLGYERLLDDFVYSLRQGMDNLVNFNATQVEDIATYVRPYLPLVRLRYITSISRN